VTATAPSRPRFEPNTFELPPDLEASAPPEARGLRREGVRLMVARRGDGSLSHRYFTDLPQLLEPGDVLAVNTSATLPASLPAEVDGGGPATLQLSGRLPGGLWVVELRHRSPARPWLDAAAGTVVRLPAGGRVALRTPASSSVRPERGDPVRLWVATVDVPEPLLSYLAGHGRPIRYGYVPVEWPISSYQTVFAQTPGSAEMPSAARPFSAELVARLVSQGIGIAPFVLHCGVSSPESHEPPLAEWFRVPAVSAAQLNAARTSGHRIVAVGTTAVRALETVTDAAGVVHPGEGWTELVVTPDRHVRSVDGLITGWHEPGASHLAMLEAIAGPDLVADSYVEALSERYLWHEFGDSHLVLP
jgi:S-adenosylmethionine:tRNA ribosyltransferase-isomerase